MCGSEGLADLSDADLLAAVADRVLARPSVELTPAASLERTRALLRQGERLRAAALDGVRDLDARELYALDGAGNIYIVDTENQAIRRIEASPTTAMTDRATELREQGRDVISLSVGEPDFATPPHVIAAAKQALDAGDTRYTPVMGTARLGDPQRRSGRSWVWTVGGTDDIWGEGRPEELLVRFDARGRVRQSEVEGGD